MKKVAKLLIIIFLFALFTSCANKPAPSSDTDKICAIDWKKEGFAVEKCVEIQQQIWPSSYDEWKAFNAKSSDEYEFALRGMIGCDSNSIFRIWGNPSEESENNFIEKYCYTSNESSIYDLNKMIPESYNFINAKLLSDDRIAIYIGKKTEEDDFWVYEISVTDYEKIVAQISVNELVEKTGNHDMLLCDYYVDKDDNFFITTAKDGDSAKNVYVFGSSGELLADFIGKDNEIVYSLFQDEEDDVFFSVYDTQCSSMSVKWYNPEQKQFKTVINIEDDCPLQIFGKYDECILYQSVDGIVKWNILTGKRKNVLPMTYDGYREYLSYNDNGEITIHLYKSTGDLCFGWTVRCANDPVDNSEKSVKIINLTNADKYIEDAVILASQRNPEFSFQYEECNSSQLQDTKTRVFTEMMSGAGPDVLYLSYEDFQALGKKGMLMNISDLLSTEELFDLLPGAIELGTIEGKPVGIPCDISITSGVTLNSIYGESSWRLDDIYSLAETGNYSDILFQSIGSFAPRALFNILMDFELSRNHFLNLEAKTCSFDTAEFESILKKSNEYAHIPINTDVALGQNGGICLLTNIDVEVITELLQQYAEETNFVGYPSEENSGHIISSEGIIAINIRSNNIPAIKYFLECVLSDEVQYAYNGPSITKMTVQKAELDKHLDDSTIYWRGIPLYVMENGMTSLDVYTKILDSCHPAYTQNEEIVKEILKEEASSYFDGQKSESEVAKIVQNRVSLWMKEK